MQFIFDKLKKYVDTLPREDSQPWKNVSTFMSGNSRTRQLELLENPYWNLDDRLMLYAFAAGIKPVDWFALTSEQKTLKLLKKATLFDDTVFVVMGHAFERLAPYYKHKAYNTIVENLPENGLPWAAGLLSEWAPSTPDDVMYKIQSYTLFLERTLIGQHIWGRTQIENKGNHAMWKHCMDDLNSVVAQGVTHWSPTQEWIYTWRQLEGFPQFFNRARHVHPWLQTIVTLYTGNLNYDRPKQAIMFEDATSRTEWASLAVSYGIHDDSLKVDDIALANAVYASYQRHTKQVAPKASIEALYTLIKELQPLEAMALMIGLESTELSSLPYSDLLVDTMNI